MTRIGALSALAAVAVLGAGCGEDDPLDSPAERLEAGERLFGGAGTCHVCHGSDLEGTAMGPSLLDERYGPDRLSDDSIRSAIRNGVPAEHFDFGPMPALPHLGAAEVEAIVAYVRARQEDAGIT